MKESALTHQCDDCRGEIMTIDKERCPHCGSLSVKRLPTPSKTRLYIHDFDEPTRQRTLLDGMNCLPGQLDLF
jgi:hypothetical protein